MISKVDFAIKLSEYTSLNSFICLKWILKNLSTIMHTQFNHYTLPVTPFNIQYYDNVRHTIKAYILNCISRTEQKPVAPYEPPFSVLPPIVRYIIAKLNPCWNLSNCSALYRACGQFMYNFRTALTSRINFAIILQLTVYYK